MKGNSLYPSAGVMAFILISLMYSFGTFGFLNLFGVRSIVQAILVGLITLVLISMRFNFKIVDFFTVSVFSILYMAGSLIYWGQKGSLIDSYILVFCLILFFYTPPKNIIFFSKVLVITTTILCILVAIASVYYQIYPSEVAKANIRIYDSMVGHNRLNPGYFMDFISFTSGDGFSVMGHKITRMKGYSNEPSSTIVHYVAPAVIAFLLGGRYVYLGLFILFVNVVGIVSFTTYIILIISLGFFSIKFIPNKFGKILLYFVIFCFIYIVTNPEVVLEIFRYASKFALDYAGFDLISRKIGDGTANSNLGERHLGIMDGFRSAFTSPLGYPSAKLASAGGLFGEISSRTGWVGLFIFGLFIVRMIKNIKVTYFNIPSLSYLFGISLIIGIMLVALFITAYGWLRPAGIIMFLLYFRLLQLAASGTSALPKFGNRKFFNLT